jgi:menaquinone-9 beta-reductase
MEAVGTRARSTQARQSDFDLVVIGAGPAGTSAAITAARAGAHVLLLERGRFPRQRVCGEFVSAESLDLLAGLLQRTDPDLLRSALRIPKARLFFDGHTISTEVAPAAASIARRDLDSALWWAAEDAGVTARSQTAVENIAENGHFLLSTSAGEFHSKAVINATGRWSNLGSKPSLTDQNSGDKWLGVKGHFSESSPHPSVDLYFFEGGYCGVQPVALAEAKTGEERINVCAMIRSDIGRSLPDVFAQHAQLKERSRSWKPLMDPVSTSPLIFREPQQIEDGILMAGDAAGFVDPFIGDGISLALRSGTLAAECLVPFFQAQTPLAEATFRYGKVYRQHLLPIFRNSSIIRWLLKLPRPIRRSVGHLLETNPAVSRLLVRLTR